MQKDSLKNNTIWNTIGSLIHALSQWLIIVVIAKLGNPEMVGEYSLALAITAPISMFFGGKLRLIYVTDFTEHNFSEYLNYKYISSLISILGIVFIILITSYNLSLSMVILLIGLLKIGQDISELFYGVFQKELKMKYIGISKIVKAFVSIVIFILIMKYNGNLILSIIGMLVSTLLITGIYDYRKVKIFVKPYGNLNLLSLNKIFFLSLPLSIMTLLNSLSTNVPRYIIEAELDLNSLGYFTALFHLIYAGNILIDSLRQPMIPVLSDNYKQKNKNAYKLNIFKVLVVGFSLSLVGLIVANYFGEALLTIIYSSDYAEHNKMFILMIMASGFIYGTLILDSGISAARKFRIQPLIGMIWLVSSILFSFYFINNFGLYGAAIALLIHSIFKFLSFLVLVFSILRSEHWGIS